MCDLALRIKEVVELFILLNIKCRSDQTSPHSKHLLDKIISQQHRKFIQCLDTQGNPSCFPGCSNLCLKGFLQTGQWQPEGVMVNSVGNR